MKACTAVSASLHPKKSPPVLKTVLFPFGRKVIRRRFIWVFPQSFSFPVFIPQPRRRFLANKLVFICFLDIPHQSSPLHPLLSAIWNAKTPANNTGALINLIFLTHRLRSEG